MNEDDRNLINEVGISLHRFAPCTDLSSHLDLLAQGPDRGGGFTFERAAIAFACANFSVLSSQGLVDTDYIVIGNFRHKRVDKTGQEAVLQGRYGCTMGKMLFMWRAGSIDKDLIIRDPSRQEHQDALAGGRRAAITNMRKYARRFRAHKEALRAAFPHAEFSSLELLDLIMSLAFPSLQFKAFSVPGMSGYDLIKYYFAWYSCISSLHRVIWNAHITGHVRRYDPNDMRY